MKAAQHPRHQRWAPWPILLMGLLLLNALGVWLPLLAALLSAFKSTAEIMLNPFALPQQWSLANFQEVWQAGSFGLYFRNSVLVLLGAETIILGGAALAGYALGRLRFAGRELLYALVLVGMMLPAKLLLVPLFVQLKSMGLLDNLFGLALVYGAGGLPAGIFIMTSFFRAQAQALEDAARIDGANEWAVFRHIMLPLVRPAWVLVAVYTAVPIWNDFLLPTVFISTPELKTVPQGLSVFFGEHAVNMGALFAGLSVAALPLVLVYLLLSDTFIRGLTAGAVKG